MEGRAWPKPAGSAIAIGLGALVVLGMWLSWFFAPSFWNESLDASPASRADYEALVGVLVVLVGVFGWYVWTRSQTDSPILVVAGLAVLAAGLIVGFASAYFYFGGPQNFGGLGGPPSPPRMSHIDALSLAVGTLTTAGSSVSARSQWAKGLVMTQQLVDFVFIGLIATIAVGRIRIASRRQTRPLEPLGGEGSPQPRA